MADIKKELNDIKNAVYGREVRGSIHDGIKKINDESEESKQKAEEAHEITQNLLDETFDSAALEANFEQRLNDEIANLQPEWTEFKNDVTAQLTQKAEIQFEPITVYVPGDYPTINEAITKLSEFKTKRNVYFNIMIQSGYKPTERIYLVDGDYSKFRLSSEDEIVYLDPSFPQEPFIQLQNAMGPTINTIFNGGGYCTIGIAVYHNSTIKINQGCGFTHAGHDNLMVRYGGIATANYAILTHASQVDKGTNPEEDEEVTAGGYAGISAWGGMVYAHGADVSYSERYGARAAYAGTLYFQGGVANNCKSHGIRASHAGIVEAREATADNAGRHGIYALAGSIINAYYAKARNTGNYGVIASQASMIDARYADVSGSRNGVRAFQGSTVNFMNGEAIDCTGDYGINAYGSSRVNATSCRIQGAYMGIRAEKGSEVNANLAWINRSSGRGLAAYDGSTINADVANIQFIGVGNASANGVRCEDGSRINLRRAAVRESGGRDIYVNTGGIITANECRTTGSTDYAPMLEDVNVTAFNTWTRIGVIFN